MVFESYLGDVWAVQAKCFAPESSIKKEDMDSFISESADDRFQGRLLITSTNRIGTNADRVLDRKNIVRFLLEDFKNSAIIFPKSLDNIFTGKRKDLKTPLPHQQEAIEKVFKKLQFCNKGQIHMACGTGKTLTSLWIKEKLKAKKLLVLMKIKHQLSKELGISLAAAGSKEVSERRMLRSRRNL